MVTNILRKRRILKNNVHSINNVIKNKNTFNKKVDLSFYKKNDKTKIIITAGLLVERKGFMNLFESIVTVKKKYDNFVLLVCGDGSDYKKLQNFIYSENIENEVKLLGHKNNLIEYMNASDFFILPSIKNEDSPYVIVEALMLAKPIISTKVAGIPEMIANNENGYLVKPNSVADLNESILKMLNLKPKDIDY